MKNKFLWTALVAVLTLSSCGKKEEQQAAPQGPAPFPVQTIKEQDAVVYQEFILHF